MKRPLSLRFAHLDGLRGLAALFVVIHHAYVAVAWTKPGLPRSITSVSNLLTQGTLAVDVFIVLSGFVLMMPVLRSPDRALRGGLIGFFKRRALRILPAYYAALAVSLLLIAIVPALSHVSGDRWDDALPAFSSSAIGSHLLLVHNFSRAWIWKIDNPMWSVATEWQIYFVFALVLLPVWRRLGMFAAVCVAMTIGAIVESYMPGDSEACFHFVGLFAFGMAAAHFVSKPRAAGRADLIGCAGCFGMIGLIACVPAFTRQPKIVVDLIVGLATALVITTTALLELRGQRGLLNLLLEAPVVRKLGEFSYSLYLMHFPIIALGAKWTHASGLNPVAQLAVLIFGVVPISIALCYVFHLMFEKPFLAKAPLIHNLANDRLDAAGNMRLAA